MATKKASKKRPPKAPTADKADLVLGLKLVRLIESKSELSIVGGKLPTKIDMKVLCEDAEPESLGDHFRLAHRVSAEATWREGDSPDGGSSIHALCRFEVLFNSTRAPVDEEVRLVQNSAAHIAWPYARAFISFLTGQMGLPTITLPVLKAGPDGISLVQL